MKLDHHEEVIKKQLGSHTEDIDVSALWDTLEEELHPKKKRRAIWFLFSGLGLISILAILAYVTFGDSQSEKYLHANKVVPKNNTSTGVDSQVYDYNKSEGQRQSIGEQLNEEHAPKNDIVSTIEIIDNTHSNELNPSSLKETEPVIIYSQSFVHFDDLPNEKTNTPMIENDRKNEIKSTQQKEIANIKNEKQGISYVSTLSNKINQHKDIGSLLLDTKASVALKEEQQHREVDPIDGTNIRFFETLKNLKINPLLNIRGKRKISAYLNFGWGLPYSKFAALIPTEIDYAHMLNTISHDVSSQHISVGLQYDLVPNIFFSTGLEFTRLVNKTRLNNVIKIDSMVNGVTRTYFKSSGDVERTMGSTRVINYTAQDIQWHTYRQLFDVPVIIGFHKKIRRFDVAAFGGVSFNLSQKANGGFVSESGMFYTFDSSDHNNPYSKTIRTSYLLGSEIGYQLNTRSSMVLNGRYKIYQDIKINDLIQQKLNNLSINLGIKYKL